MSAMSDTALQAAPASKARGYWATVGRRIRRDKVSMACAVVLLLIFASALLAPWLHLADPYQGSMIRRLRHIGTPGYPLGTDELGRDMLARLIYGGRLSLVIGILPVIFAFAIGTSLGLVAGYVGGKLNTAIMRTVDVFYAFPSVLLAIAISGALGAGITNSIVSLTIVFVPPVTRVAEAVTSGVRSLDYIDAARASGAKKRKASKCVQRIRWSSTTAFVPSGPRRSGRLWRGLSVRYTMAHSCIPKQSKWASRLSTDRRMASASSTSPLRWVRNRWTSRSTVPLLQT